MLLDVAEQYIIYCLLSSGKQGKKLPFVCLDCQFTSVICRISPPATSATISQRWLERRPKEPTKATAGEMWSAGHLIYYQALTQSATSQFADSTAGNCLPPIAAYDNGKTVARTCACPTYID